MGGLELMGVCKIFVQVMQVRLASSRAVLVLVRVAVHVWLAILEIQKPLRLAKREDAFRGKVMVNKTPEWIYPLRPTKPPK